MVYYSLLKSWQVVWVYDPVFHLLKSGAGYNLWYGMIILLSGKLV